MEKASKHSNKKEEKINLKIRQCCSYGNMKEKKKKKDWKERTELRKEHMWQCAFSHVAVPSQYFGFCDIIVIYRFHCFRV